MSQTFSAGIPAVWPRVNQSVPIGSQPTGWFDPPVPAPRFPAHQGLSHQFAAANFNAAGSNGTCDAWMMTPIITLANGYNLSYWTRTVAGTTYPDRLQIRYSTAFSSTATSDFLTNPILQEINPTQAQNTYPPVWTNFNAVVSGINGSVLGRLAFRYYVTDCGPAGFSGDVIGIDTVNYTVPEPSTLTLLLPMGFLLVRRQMCKNGTEQHF